MTVHRPTHRSTLPMHAGFSLVELMVAIALGILVSGGIITLFSSTSMANRVQARLAVIQENGRFAVARLRDDVRHTNSLFCSNSGGPAHLTSVGFAFLSRFRSPQVVSNTLTLSDGTTPAFTSSASAPYDLPSSVFLSGNECSNSSCAPAAPSSVPAMGIAAGNRVVGSDILSLRFIAGNGWKLGTGHSSLACGADNSLTSITLAQNASADEKPTSWFRSSDQVMLADCSQAQIFSVNGAMQPTNLLPLGNVKCVLPENDGRIFDFTRDFQTVRYYLQLGADDNPDAPAGRLVANLMRKVNTDPAQAIVRGVERFDLRYAVEDNLGRTRFLTADQVATRAGGTITCPPDSPNPLGGTDPGCLWRSVKSIEVNLLLDSVDSIANLASGELNYMYPPDGASVQSPPGSMSNGLDRDMMRRGFSFVVALRGYNP